MKTAHILGGGTFSHIRSHLALATPAFGSTAIELFENIKKFSEFDCYLHLTKMADRRSMLITNEDVSNLVDSLIEDPATKLIIFNVAMCDFNGKIGEIDSSKYATRLHSREANLPIDLTPSEKVLKKIRKTRKDIFLVAFKTTCGASTTEQYVAGLNLLKENSCNIVFANDVTTRQNMIIVPEEAKYSVTDDRKSALSCLATIVSARTKLQFTRSTVVPGESINWINNNDIPHSLKTVVDYCINQGAYKPFRGSTAGHFAYKMDNDVIFTSKRSSDFNKLDENGLVMITPIDNDKVLAFGAKPSVGGQSQRIIFQDHPEMDCIVHFHCPMKADRYSYIPIAMQWPYECGSHECGENTSRNLREVIPGIKTVMLDEHGPNIVFNSKINPSDVIDFINANWDLSQKTGGLFV
ncbi:MAG: class II aldolase/adducin family protein [Nitrososphaeraceae archaeon]